MSLLVFQSSRLQLLANLKRRFDAAATHRDEHLKRGETEDEHEKKSIDNLLRAMEAADEQCKRLEFWSDFRSVDQKGGVLGAADHNHGIDHEWTSTSVSGSGSEGSPTSGVEDKGKGKDQVGLESGPATRATSGGWVDGAGEKRVESPTLDNDELEERSLSSRSEQTQEAKKEQGHTRSTQEENLEETELDDTPDPVEKRNGEEDQDDVD
jgi:hypothetical protein